MNKERKQVKERERERQEKDIHSCPTKTGNKRFKYIKTLFSAGITARFIQVVGC